MLSHPRAANVAGDAIRVVSVGEVEDQDQVPVVDHHHASGQGACLDDKPHAFLRCLNGCVRHRVTQTKVIDDEVHDERLYTVQRDS